MSFQVTGVEKPLSLIFPLIAVVLKPPLNGTSYPFEQSILSMAWENVDLHFCDRHVS